MLWLTWRQSRAATAVMAGALSALAVILALTGPGLADEYATGIAACTGQSGGCSDFFDDFFQEHQGAFLAVTAVVLVLPALIGLFWGAPLIARELEAGTHRLVWNQSITRTRWLTLKLGLIGLAAMTAAGLGSLAVDWWTDPIDKTAASFARMEPLLFGARGVVPIAYAAFAFVLGVTVGMLIRRTIAAMAITLAVFVAVQIAMPLLIRPHLLSPTRSTIEITVASLDFIGRPPGDGPMLVGLEAPEGGPLAGAWVLSSSAVDASGRAVERIPMSRNGPCAPRAGGPVQAPGLPPREPAPPPGIAQAGAELAPCFAEIKRLGYRQVVSYHAAGRFWAFQRYETAIYLVLALGLAGFCLWWLRRLS